MESQIWHHRDCSVGGTFKKGTISSAHLDTRHFISSPCATGAVPAATPVLEFRGRKSMCRFFTNNFLELQKFLPLTQSLFVFAARSYGDLLSWHWNPGLGCLVWGWDSLFPRYPSQIFIHHTWILDQPVLHLCPSYQSGQYGWMWFI